MTKHIAHQLIDCVRSVSTLSTLPILITDQPNGSQVCMNESSAPHPTATRHSVRWWEESGEVAGTVGHLEGRHVVRLQMYSLCSYSYTTKQRTITSRVCDEILSFQRLASFIFHDNCSVSQLVSVSSSYGLIYSINLNPNLHTALACIALHWRQAWQS